MARHLVRIALLVAIVAGVAWTLIARATLAV
jgi:hypothetical protein